MTLAIEPRDAGELGMSATRLGDASALIDRQVADGLSPMTVALVARHGHVLWSHAVGTADDDGSAASVDSVVPIASQVEPMVAAVIMALAERGMVGLNEPAALTLAELAEEHFDVMVNHLLTHTSGWNEADVGPDDGWRAARRLAVRERMQYCSVNSSLLAEVVRRVTGGTLDAAMRRYLFEPVGMTSSSLGADDGAGGALGSAVDLARFWQLFLDGGVVDGTRVLSADAVRVMTTNQIPGIGAEVMGTSRREASFGFGFAVAGREAWPRFGGGLSSPSTFRHLGAGEVDGWVDPESGVLAVYIEIGREQSVHERSATWAGHRFADVVNSAVISDVGAQT